MTKTLIGLVLAACVMHAAETPEPPRRDIFLPVNDKLEFEIRIGPQGLFGINVECALDGSAAEIVLRANEDGRNFPLWDDGLFDTVDLEFSSNGTTLTEDDTPSYIDSWVELEEPFDFLDFLASAGSTVEIAITNPQGVRHVESLRSKSWKALAILCGSGTSTPALEPVGRDRVLIDDIEAAVDRYRSAGSP